MRREEIHENILLLQLMKADRSNTLASDLILSTGYVNIIDMLLLPLYYTWEFMGYGTLHEVNFETYLKNSYKRFCVSSCDYTKQMIQLLQSISLRKSISRWIRNLVKYMIVLFKSIVEQIKKRAFLCKFK